MVMATEVETVGTLRLREALRAQRIGVAAFAKTVGSTEGRISRLLMGSMPKADLALRLQTVLGIPIEDWGKYANAEVIG